MADVRRLRLPVVVAMLVASVIVLAGRARDDVPDPAGRFRLSYPEGWTRVDLSCEVWRYDSPDESGSMLLVVRRDVGSAEQARSAASSLSRALFDRLPTEISNPDATYHGAPIARWIGRFPSGAKGFTNSTAISLKDGASLLWIEVGLVPAGLDRDAQIEHAERHHYTWRSLRTTDKLKQLRCESRPGAPLPLPPRLAEAVGTAGLVEVAGNRSAEGESKDSEASGGIPLDQLIEAGIVEQGPTDQGLDVGGSGLAQHPFLSLHEVRVLPQVVAPGTGMVLEVELTASLSGAGDGVLPVMLRHSILLGERVVYEGPIERYDVPNDRRSTIKKNLRAASRPGSFAVEVSVSHRSAQAGARAVFEIR